MTRYFYSGHMVLIVTIEAVKYMVASLRAISYEAC